MEEKVFYKSFILTPARFNPNPLLLSHSAGQYSPVYLIEAYMTEVDTHFYFSSYDMLLALLRSPEVPLTWRHDAIVSEGDRY